MGNIKPKNTTAFLVIIKQYHSKGKLSDMEYQQIQWQLLQELEKRIQAFTGGDSSVSKEQGQALMDAILYIITLYIQTLSDEQVVNYLIKQSIAKLLKDAEQWMKDWVDILHDTICQIKVLAIDLEVYTDTLVYGLPRFKELYNLRYAPFDSVLTLDYPTYLPLQNQEGITRISEYVKYQTIEHQFLNTFSITTIMEMLKYYHSNYQHHIFNIPKLIWRQLLLLNIFKNQSGLVLTMTQIESIYRYFLKFSKEEINTSFKEVFYKLIEQYHIYDIASITYFEQGITEVITEIYYGIQYRVLDKESSIKE